MADKPNVLFVMTDQQRFDTIAALGNEHIYTPNLDRLVRRGISFTNGYTTCPVCVAARYSIRTGCEPPTTRSFTNGIAPPAVDQAGTLPERCGPYLAERMKEMGYRTFGIGKFHSHPRDEDLGYEMHLHSEELYGTSEMRGWDAYASFIAREHPEYDFIEGLMGERTEMYYMPQMSPMPAEVTVEAWAADRAIEQVQVQDGRPFFGMVSFIGPHPPLAPPIPFNRMYDPDRMPDPVRGDLEIDHMDEQIPWMNYAIWAENINDPHARVLKTRYYGEISYIDHCLGRILDAVEERGNGEDTLVCFFADHGDHLGDHHAWQKESFFEAACHIPFLVSWPGRLPAGARREELVSLADLFAIATGAAGELQVREGVDVLGMVDGRVGPRDYLFSYYGTPGTPLFKIMVRHEEWKFIFMANGGGEQLFNLGEDPDELEPQLERHPEVAAQLRDKAVEVLQMPGTLDALDGDEMKSFPFEARELRRIYQFDRSRGVQGFPEHPGDVLEGRES